MVGGGARRIGDYGGRCRGPWRPGGSATLTLALLAVSATHKETKQFFTLYNTLDDKKVYLEKEVSGGHAQSHHRPRLLHGAWSHDLMRRSCLQVNLLNSIHDNFQQ